MLPEKSRLMIVSSSFKQLCAETKTIGVILLYLFFLFVNFPFLPPLCFIHGSHFYLFFSLPFQLLVLMKSNKEQVNVNEKRQGNRSLWKKTIVRQLKQGIDQVFKKEKHDYLIRYWLRMATLITPAIPCHFRLSFLSSWERWYPGIMPGIQLPLALSHTPGAGTSQDRPFIVSVI